MKKDIQENLLLNIIYYFNIGLVYFDMICEESSNPYFYQILLFDKKFAKIRKKNMFVPTVLENGPFSDKSSRTPYATEAEIRYS